MVQFRASFKYLAIFWFRACSIRFFNSMLDFNSETLRCVLKTDLYLASFDSSCWSAQVSNAFNGLQGSAMFKQKMLRATRTGSHARVHLRVALQTFEVWREAKFFMSSHSKQESSHVSQVVWEF